MRYPSSPSDFVLPPPPEGPNPRRSGPDIASRVHTAAKSWMRENAVVIRAGTILLVALVLTPAALTAGRSWLNSGSAITRPVMLQGPIVGFRQARGQIEVTIDASAARPASGVMRLSVTDASKPEAEHLYISLRHGQTFANARLPEHLAEASTLGVAVEHVQTMAQN